MTVKEWLNKGRKLNIEIAELKKAKDNAFVSACGGSAAGSEEKVQTSLNNGTEGKFSAYAQYSADMDDRLKELYTYQRKMLKLINRVDDSTYRALLTARYINCETWEQIAIDMNYSYVHIVHRLHPQALDAINIYYKRRNRM